MGWTKVQDLVGPPGTFDTVTVVQLPYGELPYTVLGGTAANRTLTLYIPRGQPGLAGLNAVANDAAFASAIETDATATQTALNAMFVRVRVYDEVTETYPPRIAGAVNVFVGGPNPGLAMDPDFDIWGGLAAVTMEEVVSAALDSGSDLYAAIAAVGAADSVPITLFSAAGSSLERVAVGSAPSRVFGWKLPDGSSSVVFGSAPVPASWSNIRVRIRWMHTVPSGSGSARLFCEPVAYTGGETIVAAGNVTTSQPVNAENVPKDTLFSGGLDVGGNGSIAVSIGRLGSSGEDTFSGDIYILDARAEKQA